nr:hypothetical protein [Tanacetum cinerariifolium]
MDSIEKCIVERALHEQEIQNSKTLECSNSEKQSSTYGNESNRPGNECSKKSNSRDVINIRPSYDTEPIAEVPYTVEYNVFAVETQHIKELEFVYDSYMMKMVDCNTTPDSSDMCNNEFKDDQNADDHEDERGVLAKLISNLKLDTDENKKI